jgi:hypothetical protein
MNEHVTLRLLPPDVLACNWHVVVGPIAEALSHGQGESTATDYLKKALNKQAHVWAVESDGKLLGVGITQFLQYTQHKTLHVVAYAGEGWQHWASSLFGIVEQFAKNNGAIAIEQWGRPGWSRVLPKVIPGFEVAYHVMRKKL